MSMLRGGSVPSFWKAAVATVCAVVALATMVQAQIIVPTDESASAVRYGDSIATRYRVGAKIAAKGGTVQNILVMVAVPLECPEQEVLVVEEDFSPHVEGVEFRTLPDDKRAQPAARQMLITISELPPRQVAHALVTYEVITKAVLPPEESATALLKAPARPDRTLKPYLAVSPFINVNHRKIREAVREALAPPKDENSADEAKAYAEASAIISPGDEHPADDESPQELIPQDPFGDYPAEGAAVESPGDAESRNDWQRVEALYDYVIKHVDYEEGAADKSALDALQQGKADCHGIAALFVAMCRTEKIPARMVWVDGHQYAEFYLEDAAGQGHWYPVQSAGTRAFGEMPTPKVILQKGDNFRVPERRGERLRYASDYTLLLSSPKHKPKVTYVREQL